MGNRGDHPPRLNTRLRPIAYKYRKGKVKRTLRKGLFTPFLRVLFTFPLRYLYAIGLPVVFRLGRWCCQIQTGFLRPRPTQDTAINLKKYLYGTITLYGTNFHYVSNSFLDQISQSYNPDYALLHKRFGLFRVRSPLLAESLLFSSPKGT